MSVRAVCHRYAKALAGVVLERNEHERVFDELSALHQLYSESLDFRQVIASPAITSEQKQSVLDTIYHRMDAAQVTRNFVNLLLRNYRLTLLSEMLEAFRDALDKRLGYARVEMVSAGELSEEEKNLLASKLEAVTKKKVRAQFQSNPSLIAGAVARVGSVVYDGSLRTKLETFKNQLKSAEG